MTIEKDVEKQQTMSQMLNTIEYVVQHHKKDMGFIHDILKCAVRYYIHSKMELPNIKQQVLDMNRIDLFNAVEQYLEHMKEEGFKKEEKNSTWSN